MRRFLAHGFSQRSLSEQEYIITDCIDRALDQIGKLGADPKGINIVQWFNMLTFDIIGELAFGESFGGIESGERAACRHANGTRRPCIRFTYFFRSNPSMGRSPLWSSSKIRDH